MSSGGAMISEMGGKGGILLGRKLHESERNWTGVGVGGSARSLRELPVTWDRKGNYGTFFAKTIIFKWNLYHFYTIMNRNVLKILSKGNTYQYAVPLPFFLSVNEIIKIGSQKNNRIIIWNAN